MAGSGLYRICLQSDGIGALAAGILDIDPRRVQYIRPSPSDHKQDVLPIFQDPDIVTWIFEYVTDALVDQLRPLVGTEVFIRTRELDKYTWGNKKAVFDDFQTPSRVRGPYLEGRVTFINVEEWDA